MDCEDLGDHPNQPPIYQSIPIGQDHLLRRQDLVQNSELHIQLRHKWGGWAEWISEGMGEGCVFYTGCREAAGP